MTQISILTLTECTSSKSLPVLTSCWPSHELTEMMLFFVHTSTNTRQEHFFNLSHHPNEPQEKVQQGCSGNLVIVPGCSWPYQLVVTVRESSLLPHQWLLYFPTCQVNIWKWVLALEADCCSHSCDYGHNTKNPLCGETTPVGFNTVAQRWYLYCIMFRKKNKNIK